MSNTTDEEYYVVIYLTSYVCRHPVQVTKLANFVVQGLATKCRWPWDPLLSTELLLLNGLPDAFLIQLECDLQEAMHRDKFL